MSTPATPAVTPQTDSAPVVPASLPELSSLTAEQRQTWRETGEMPLKQDSAPAAKKDPAVADSAPQTKDKPAVSASDSATEKKPQPHRKPEDYGEKRFQDLANENKTLKERLEALERRSAPDKRDDKQVSQPAAAVEEKVKPLREFLEEWFAKNPGKKYEDGVEAWADAKDKLVQKQIDQRIHGERQRIAQEAAAKDLQVKLTDAETRYGKEEAAKIIPAVGKIVADPQVPAVIKAMLDRSDVLVDLAYTISSDAAEFDSFLKLCKSDPPAALEKLITVQALVREQLKSNAGKSAATRGADGKFQKTGKEAETASEDADKTAATQRETAEPITRATRPPVEVGGRNSAPEDPAASAVKQGNFRAAKEAFTRQYADAHKL